MSLLTVINYDPTTAVTKSTAVTQAMAALDTTNLRATFTVPSTGKVLVRLQCVVHGATTYPQILLGVIEGSSVVHRQAPKLIVSNAATSSLCVAEAMFAIGGLTAGASKTWDAAWAVETTVASTGIKYGGPNNATTNDAFGAFVYEVWEG